MKPLFKPLAFLAILLCTTLSAQTNVNQQPQIKSTMKNYALLPRYSARQYTSEEIETLKQKWITVLSSWKSRGIYVSGQVLSQEGVTVRGTAMTVTDGPADENGLRLGAVVTIRAASMEEALAIASECPALAFNGTVELREVQQQLKPAGRVIFIDSFIVPEKARQPFLERVAINRSLLKTLPGFIEDHAYEKTTGESRFNYITVATWQNQEAIDNAKKEIISLYAKQNFNMPEFLKNTGITLERAIYREME
jgi:hypothetical protein